MRIYLLAAALLTLAACGSKPSESPEPKAKEAKPPKIVHFYANTPVVPKGDTVTLCYGTEDADAVQMIPYDDELRPSFNRCVGATPTKETTYTLTATSAAGSVSQSVTVKVGPPEPKSAPADAAAAENSRQLIQNFQYLGAKSVPAGTTVQLCYTTVEGTASVSVAPRANANLAPGKNQCFPVTVQKTTNYILTAKAADGAVDRMQVTIPVQ